MNRLLKVSKVRKIKTSQGNYAIDITTERKVKRFYKDKDGKLQVEYKKYPVTTTEYFFRRKMIQAYYKTLMNKLEKENKLKG